MSRPRPSPIMKTIPAAPGAESRAVLDLLPELFSTALQTAHIVEQADGVICSFVVPHFGKQVASGPSAKEAIRAALDSVYELVSSASDEQLAIAKRESATHSAWQERAIDQTQERHQSKERQMTIGVSIPTCMKLELQAMGARQNESFSSIARRLVSIGFEDFDDRSFRESTSSLMSSISSTCDGFGSSTKEQVMLRVDPHLGVRLRSSAKQYRKSASEFSAFCLTYGYELRCQHVEIERKIANIKGAAVRKFAPQVGMDKAIPVLTGVLTGSIASPKALIVRISALLSISESALESFLRDSFTNRAVPAFKAENNKPQMYATPTPWATAVRSLDLPDEVMNDLLSMDD